MTKGDERREFEALLDKGNGSLSGANEAGRYDLVLIIASGCAEHGVWKAIWTADHLDRTLPTLFVWLGFAAIAVGALASFRVGPRFGAIGTLGLFLCGCLMMNDGRALLGATLVNAGHHAFVPCLLALFAERFEPAGPSASRYARAGAFLLLLLTAVGVAPAFLDGATPGGIHAVCTLLAVGAAIAIGAVRAARRLAAPLPPLAQSAYRGAAPRETGAATPITDGLRLIAPVVIPAVVFAFIAGSRPHDSSSAFAADFVRPLIAGSGAIVFFLPTVLHRKGPPPAPLTIFGGALFLAGGAWTLTRLPATWGTTDAGMMGIVSAMAPLATTYAVLAARGRAAVVVIASFYACITLAAYAGQSVPHREDWSVMLAIVVAALALVSGVWCVQNASKLHERLEHAHPAPPVSP